MVLEIKQFRGTQTLDTVVLLCRVRYILNETYEPVGWHML